MRLDAKHQLTDRKNNGEKYIAIYKIHVVVEQVFVHEIYIILLRPPSIRTNPRKCRYGYELFDSSVTTVSLAVRAACRRL